MIIDYGYAANLEELQSVIKQLTDIARTEYALRVKDRHFDPSIVQLGGMQIRADLGADILEDGSTVFDIRFAFLSIDEAQRERSARRND